MNNERLILLTTLVLGFLVLNSNLAYAGVAVVERSVNESVDEGANFQQFHEPETAGFVGDVLASNSTEMAALGTKVERELKTRGEIENVEVSV
ncbi:MAG: hypothetical protein HUJ31_19130, partial [Pseudomonadales bacterium]|nr:hypothetical protein [Pseudomonadales bacterium]